MDDHKQIHYFNQYCDVCVSMAIGQALTIESKSNAIQSSVSMCLKEQFTEVINQAKECLKSRPDSYESMKVL